MHSDGIREEGSNVIKVFISNLSKMSEWISHPELLVISPLCLQLAAQA